MDIDRGSLVAGLVIGLVLGAAVTAYFVPVNRSTESPWLASYTTASGCADNSSKSSWVVQVPGEDVTVAVRHAFTHTSSSLNLTADLIRKAPSSYELRIQSEPDRTAKPVLPGCTPETEFQAGLTLPENYGDLTITYNGTKLTRVDNPEDSAITVHDFSDG